MDKLNIDLRRLKEHFDVHNRTENKSPRTVGWYNEVLGMFIKWLGEHGFSTNLGSVGESEVRQFILYIKEKPGINGPMSSHSVSNRVRALRAFFSPSRMCARFSARANWNLVRLMTTPCRCSRK